MSVASLSSPSVVAPTRLRLPDLLHATDRSGDDGFILCLGPK